MSVTTLTRHVNSLQKQTHVPVGMNILFGYRGCETRPARTGIKLRLRAEQCIAAADAPEEARVVKLIIGARKSSVGTLMACDAVLFGVEQFPPLGI